MQEISRYAVVNRTSQLDDDVRIGAFAYIGPEVRIGPGCNIESSVTITGRTTLGANNHVFPMAVIGAGEAGPETDGGGEVIIGEANAIREHVTISPGREKPTRIGSDNLIMIACHIGPGVTIGDHGIFVNYNEIGPGACIEDYVRTSAFVVIKPGVTVGAYTFTVGYAEIDRDVPPFAMVQGAPLRVRGVHMEKLRRCGFGADDIRALKGAFRELFNGADDDVNEEALKNLLDDPDGNPHVLRLAQSLQRSRSGRTRS
jgi:UDP-N-acetylglucosamine acyltransferase